MTFDAVPDGTHDERIMITDYLGTIALLSGVGWGIFAFFRWIGGLL